MLIKGIFTDVEVNNQPPGFARHLKNVLLTEKLGTPINEPGFVVHIPGAALPYTVIGVHVIDEAIVLWSTDNTSSEIGLVENGAYKKILNDADLLTGKLDFNTDAPIEAENYLNFTGDRIVAWIDNINEPRILNIDTVKVDELNDIRIFPFSNPPLFDFTVLDSGGALESGVHQPVFSYANRDGLQTNWFSLEVPIDITNDPLTTNYTDYDGTEAGTITSKAIQLSLSEVDTRFELLRIGVVKTIGGVVTAQKVREVTISGESFTALYTGTEGTIEDLSLDEILVPTASYKNAKAMGQVANKLYLADLTVEEEVDLTDVALDVKLQWVASYEEHNPRSLALNGSQKNPMVDKTFMPGEVYAFYLVGELDDGRLTKGFHIPGRELDTVTGESKAPGTYDKDLNSEAATGQLSGTPLNFQVNSSIQNTQVTGPSAFGEFGYWENDNEVYPGTSIVNTPVSYPMEIISTFTDATTQIRIFNSALFGPMPALPSDIILTGFTTGNGTYPIVLYGDDGTNTTVSIVNTTEVITGVGTVRFSTNATVGRAEAYNPVSPSQDRVKIAKSTGVEITDFSTQDPFTQVTLQGLTQGDGTYPSIRVTEDSANIYVQVQNANYLIGSGTISYNKQTVIGTPGLSGKVRHHRFPTLNQLFSFSAFGNSVGKSIMPNLSVSATNVNIPPELQGRVKRWFLAYAKRTPANATVVGQAMYQYAGLDESEYVKTPVGGIGKKFSSGIANCSIGNTENSGEFGPGSQDSQQHPHQQIIKFNSFDLLEGQPAIGSLYLRQEIKYRETGAFDNKGTNPVIINPPVSGQYANARGINGGAVDPGNTFRYLFMNMDLDYSTSATNPDHLLREVEDYTYLPPNVIDNTALGVGADLRVAEGGLFLKVKGGQPAGTTLSNFSILPDPDGIPALDININSRIAGRSSDGGTDNAEDTYLSTLCQRKLDVYVPYTDQDLVFTTGKVASTTTAANFKGGDSRTAFTGIKCLAPYAAHPEFKNLYTSGAVDGDGAQSIRYFPSYCTKNVGLRHSINSDKATIYYPKTGDFYDGIFRQMNASNFRRILYNEDYSLNNEYTSVGIWNPLDIPGATQLPHTIVSSVTQKVEERSISWQTFLSADRYVMPRDKGPIINLQGFAGDRLYIHQRDSLFVTRSTATLKTDITEVTLGSGDLFAVLPQEVLSTEEGFGGTQHKFGCKLTKIGYVFPDAAQGKIFVHNGDQLQEISKQGQRIFFRDEMPSDVDDNPFMGQGYTTAYDEKYNRLIIGVANGARSFTASYSPATEAWASYHDYFPEFLIQTRKTLKSLKNDAVYPGYGGIYEHNVGDFGIYYNVVEINPTPYPMLIDVVYNDAPYDQKIFGAVEWASEVIQAGGIQAKDETIDYITLSNNNKTTGRVELERLLNLSQVHGVNTRNVGEFWSFNTIRNIAIAGIPFRLDFYDDFAMIDANLDYNKPWYRKAKFIDRFMVARFEYSNLNNNKFSLLYHEPSFRKSYR